MPPAESGRPAAVGWDAARYDAVFPSTFPAAMPDLPAADAAIAPLELVEFPHPALRRPAKPLVRLDAAVREAVARMFDIMYQAQGIGLAANQVALPYRMFVVNCSGQRGEGEEHVFINPILSRPRGTAVQEEGCLSLPGVRMDVRRPERIVVEAWSLAGEPIKYDLDGLFARVVQHEFDHLEGRLFTDRLPEAAALEVRGQLEELAEVFAGKQSRGELPPEAALVADLDRLEAARCRA
jgi:peptide deformylase